MKHPSREQILAFDALLISLLQDERGQKMSLPERRTLLQATDHLRSHEYPMALLCIIASGIPIAEARGYFALLFDAQL